MATFTSVRSGTTSDINPLTNPWGAFPLPADGDKVTIASGHVVTLDTVEVWGDDTSSAVTVAAGGTLKASRSANSGLTIKGEFVVPGAYDVGSAADPVTAATHTLKPGYSAALSNGKWGCQFTGTVTMHGVLRRRNTTITSAVSAGATSAVVADATGWIVGDSLVFAGTAGFDKEDVRTISTITPGSGTSATITFTALTNGHAASCPVGNLTSNIVVKPYSTSAMTYFALKAQSGSAASSFHVTNVRFEEQGTSGAAGNKEGMLSFVPSVTTNTNLPYDTITSCVTVSSVTTGTAGQIYLASPTQRIDFVDLAQYIPSSLTFGIHPFRLNDGYFHVTDGVVYAAPSVFVGANAPAYCLAATLIRHKVFGVRTSAAMIQTRGDLLFDTCVWGPVNFTTFRASQIWGGEARFANCDMWATFGAGSLTTLFDGGNAISCIANLIFDNCNFASGLSYVANISNTIAKVAFSSRNGDPTVQEIHTPRGVRSRSSNTQDSATPATGSWRWAPSNAIDPMSDSIDVFGQGGQICGIAGYYYLHTTKPTSVVLQISGTGITTPVPQALDMAASSGVWHPFLITVVPTVTSDGFTLLGAAIEVVGPSNSYIEFDGLQQVFADFDPGAISFFKDGRPRLGARTLAPDIRYEPLAGIPFPAGSVGEQLQRGLTLGQFIALK